MRERFARLLGAAPDEVALTHHTTEGMNIAVWGLPWQAGDEIVTATHEHEGALLPDLRGGAALRAAPADRGRQQRRRRSGRRHDRRPHPAHSPGSRLARHLHHRRRPAPGHHCRSRTPGRRAGCVDGAQALGALPVNVHELGVDFYAATAQKWLCGPEGLGALYVRRDRLTDLAPTYIGFFAISGPEAVDLTGYFMPAPGAGGTSRAPSTGRPSTD